MKKIAIAMGIAALTGSAFAQGIVVERVQGAATVSSGDQATTLSTNMALTENATVTTTQGSSVTIKFPSGCTAVVAGGASFVVSEANCKALLAQAGGGTGGAGAGASHDTALLLAGGAAGVFAIHEATKGDGPKARPTPPGGPAEPGPAPEAPGAKPTPKPRPKPTPISPS